MSELWRQFFRALLYAALSLPVMYGITAIALSCIEHGYVRVDPVRLRRITVALSTLVLVVVFLLQRLR